MQVMGPSAPGRGKSATIAKQGLVIREAVGRIEMSVKLNHDGNVISMAPFRAAIAEFLDENTGCFGNKLTFNAKNVVFDKHGSTAQRMIVNGEALKYVLVHQHSKSSRLIIYGEPLAVATGSDNMDATAAAASTSIKTASAPVTESVDDNRSKTVRAARAPQENSGKGGSGKEEDPEIARMKLELLQHKLKVDQARLQTETKQFVRHSRSRHDHDVMLYICIRKLRIYTNSIVNSN